MPSMLPAREYALLQADLEATLTDTCVVWRRTRTLDSNGMPTNTWVEDATAAGTFACRVVPVTRLPDAALYGPQIQDRMRYQLTCGTDVLHAASGATPYFRVGDQIARNSQRYEVESIEDLATNALCQRAIIWRKMS